MAVITMILSNPFEPDIRVYKEAKYLVENGNEVEILCWDRSGEKIDVPTEMYGETKVTRFFVKSVYGTGFKQIGAMLNFAKACKRYLKGKKVDYLHCHDLDGIVIGILLRLKNAKLIFDMHEYYFNSNRIADLIVKKAVQYCQKKAYKIIYVNDLQKESVSAKNENKLIFLPNYPQKAIYGDIKKTPSDKLRINYIGNIRQLEELYLLAKSVEGNNNVNVLIRGFGLMSSKLRERTEGIANFVVGEPYDGIADSGDLFRNTDVMYCVYSRKNINNSNAFAVKYYESIITQTPMIVSNFGVMAKDVIAKDIGYVVEENDIESIKSVINDIETNRENFNKKKENISKFSDVNSWEKVVTCLDFYKK